MRKEFADRADLLIYLQSEFPEAVSICDSIPPIRGGRSAALQALEQIDPVRYAESRNELSGAVTGLSPYIRHGILSLPEVRDKALQKVKSPRLARTLIRELGWRAYFQSVYLTLGRDIWQDVEPYKTGFSPSDYADSLPDDVRESKTGLACIDAFSRELRQTGYLHNHIRLWLAAYIVHWRRVQWQAGARWFLTHLLDGDPASNNLSWQWVASTFSHKPYIFNRENLERFAGDRYCRSCPLRGRCELDASYEALNRQLFPAQSDTPQSNTAQNASDDGLYPARDRLANVELAPFELEDRDSLQPDSPVASSATSARAVSRPLVWVHGDCLNPDSPVLRQFPDAPALFVWDDALLARAEISLKRILFLYESLLEMPVDIRRGPVAEALHLYAIEKNCDAIVTLSSSSPRFASIVKNLSAHMPVTVVPQERFLPTQMTVDLRRFSRFWRTVEDSVLDLR